MNKLTISLDHRGNIVSVRKDGSKIRLKDEAVSITRQELEEIELTTELIDLKLVVEHSIDQGDEHGTKLLPGIVLSIKDTILNVDLLYLPASTTKCIDWYSMAILGLQFIRAFAKKFSEEGILADDEVIWKQDVIGHGLTLALPRSSFREMFLRLDQIIESLANVFPKLETKIDEMISEAVTDTMNAIGNSGLHAPVSDRLPE